jgi:MoaA/NifB/PqqE/SkfB family radical SAM enzyme
VRIRPPEYIEVELGSYCNRECSWCPNGWSDRGHRRESMPEAVWKALLADLRDSSFDGTFAFHNYNEPLADPKLLMRVRQARRAMPGARLSLFTNGDLLTRPFLGRLGEAQVDEVRVTRYPSERKRFDEPNARTLARYVTRLGLEYEDGPELDDARFIGRTLQHGPLTLIVRAPRVKAFGSRAGAVKLERLAMKGRRDWPCYQPSASAAIDYHGNLKICCHIYDTKDPLNANAIVGNVGQTPFSQLWRSDRLNAIRRALEKADYRNMPMCQKCTNVWIPPDLKYGDREPDHRGEHGQDQRQQHRRAASKAVRQAQVAEDGRPR